MYHNFYGKPQKLSNGGGIAACCGARYRSGSKPGTPARKWKNQHGEGIIPAKPAVNVSVDMVNGNTQGILVASGKQKVKDDAKCEIKQIKTKDGWITVSVRKVW